MPINAPSSRTANLRCCTWAPNMPLLRNRTLADGHRALAIRHLQPVCGQPIPRAPTSSRTRRRSRSTAATYQSRWIGVHRSRDAENQQQGDGYATLDTANERATTDPQTYDRAPYVGTTSSGGGIPFIDFGGKFLSGGATYDPFPPPGQERRADRGRAPRIRRAASRKAPSGAANTFTAAICSVTHNQPASVCADPVSAKM